MDTLYTYKMLDEFLPNAYCKLPPYYPSYVKYRVRNERNGHPGLVTIRKVIEHLESEGDLHTQDFMLETICNWLLEGKRNVFCLPSDNDSDHGFGPFEDHLLVAAVYFGHIHIVEEWMKEHYNGNFPRSWVFGDAEETAKRYGNIDIIKLFITANQNAVRAQPGNSTIRLSTAGDDPRMLFFLRACRYGREDVFEEIFNFQIDKTPWPPFVGNPDEPNECLSYTFTTPSIKILKFVADKHFQPPPTGFFQNVLYDTSRCGALDVFHFIVDKGVRPSPATLYVACRHGYTEIVRAYLRLNVYSVEDRYNMKASSMDKAIHNGHTAIVELLLDHNVLTRGALERAARRGHREIVQLLLDRGVGSQESIYVAIKHATALEHDSLLDILLERSMRMWPTTDVLD